MKKIIKRLSILLIIFALFLVVGCKDEGENLETPITDALKLTANFQDKSFLKDGIGEVNLLRNVDGDTAHFTDQKGETIKIRFIGVNTPESTIRTAPWGEAASKFTKEILNNAESIVLESNGNKAELDTTVTRYLGYVWYKADKSSEYRLLNLELIELGYSIYTGEVGKDRYGEKMQSAFLKAREDFIKVNGEMDPNFNYDTTVFEIKIAELMKDFESYTGGVKLKIKARVVRMCSGSVYLEDFEPYTDPETNTTSYGAIYMYHSFVSGLGTKEPGDVISFECQATDDDNYGKQLKNPSKIRTISSDGIESIKSIVEIDDAVTSLKDYLGYVVTVRNATVTSVGNKNADGEFTIRCTMNNGSDFQVRVTDSSFPLELVTVGKKYDITGGATKYVDAYDDNKIYYQIALANFTDAASYTDFIETNR